MGLSAVVLCCILFTSVSAFKIPHETFYSNESSNLDAFAENNAYKNDICIEVCGDSNDVICEGDTSNRNSVRCSCKDKSKIFLKLDKQCRDCRCSNGKCVKDNRGKTKCNCKRGYALQDENTCARCDCGKMGKCMFIPLSKSSGGALYMKQCLCDLGSAEKNGVCVDCHCGENSKCEFEDEEKICYCIDGYAEKEGVCTKCDCGEYGECSFDNGRKVCTCDDDFEEINGYCVDKCENHKCENDGTCEVQDGKPVCTCPDRYYGTFCEIDKCSTITCYNGGACSIEEGYPVCKCPEGYFGKSCEENVCSPSPCLNYGQCYIDYGKAACRCHDRYAGERCELDKCSTITCYNGGACSIEQGNPVCECPEGYFGKSCEENVCSASPCLNYGQCYIQNGRAACRCHDRYAGERCEIDKCSTITCYNGGVCSIEQGNAVCRCPEGYFGKSCEENVCSPSPCLNNGQCYIQNGKAACRCLYRYEGERCEIDKCSYISCENGGICAIKDGNPVCECTDSYVGERCETHKCSYLHCQNGGACTIQHGKALCECPQKYTGDNCEKARCSVYSCQNGGGCRDEVCYCLPGTSGLFCDIIDECPNLCPRREDINCTYDIRNQRAYCECLDRRLGFHPDTQDCKITCEEHECRNGGTCERNGYSRFCRCLEGTTGDHCEIIPRCSEMDCGMEASCQYDESRRTAYCQCQQNDLVFDQTDRRCKRSCDEYGCKNGGACEGDDYAKFCKCLDGTTGDHCEDVPRCYDMNCGNEATCQYDEKRQTAYCQCHEYDLVFDQEDSRCKRTCDEQGCKNGGSCEGNDYSRFCKCLDGTKGDHCEIIPLCFDMNCGNEATCQYDIERQTAYCQCNEYDMVFDQEYRRCKKPCKDSSECSNGGTCIRYGPQGYCRCLDGTKGDYCEDVIGCYNNQCGDNAKCVYDIDRQIAVCKCLDENFAFDNVDYRCKKTCHDSSDCENGGSCSDDGSNKFCRCLNGTIGDNCEDIPGCKDIDCGNVAICEFDIDRKAASCQCNDPTLAYDVISKLCQKPCVDDSVCQNEGLCMYRGYNRFCHCKEGTSGDYCEEVDICNKICGKGENVVCKYDLRQKIAECLCKEENYEFDTYTKTCKKCECGGKEISCNIRDGRKVCNCPNGYSDIGGKCKKTSCTDKKCLNGRCHVNNNEEEVCLCYEGFFLDGDECRRKQCTHTPCYNGTCVVRNNGREECICPAGYTLRFNACIRGACRIDTCFGGQCKVIDGELTCKCPERYHLEGIGCFETVCKIQHCFGGRCVVKDGEEICTCHEGYYLENDVCKKILCEKKNCFGGQCHIRDGVEECECPAGYSIVDDVCVLGSIKAPEKEDEGTLL